ncbi:NADPH-dependent FMN reductase [Facklamia sp. 7083-14-GEN3]|uniref:NADPH-dependent FMN reductase n=1 Tax=Facklamia sp. 7083-14-GEN3 TaxID=2973478 RepID=UPI00215D0D12|nr:NADPH-dependent FMN reductase [Facklamia sp. 7083-14-GEN3]MCR8968648.1 NAD(P)H-dependent oxidoreductase [Facklamia sp. 7083-14-GEN3]
MKKIVGIVGNNSTESTNRKLLQYIQKHFQSKADIELIEIRDLPMFNKPSDGKLPSVILEMSEKIEAADGVIISTAEYDHSITSALTNALSWLSFNNFPFVDKPVMIIGASYGLLGASRAQQHLRAIMNAPVIRAMVMPGCEFMMGHSKEAFDEKGELVFPDKVQQLEAYFSDFLQFINVSELIQDRHASNVNEAMKFYREQFEK